jgi:Collagen triple helix repeat (20 copies)
MMQAIRRRVNATTVIAVFALVFAMSGGAYAAKKFLITSKGQISPSVLKALKGATGAKGANGAAGAQGPAGGTGPAGPAGAQGPQGTAGTNGTDGKEGKEGKPGTPGTTGFTDTLPSGKTETGTWSAAQENANIGAIVPLSFSIPLSEGLDGTHVHLQNQEEPAIFEESCPGSSESPKAVAGNLCVYITLEQELDPASIRTPFAFGQLGTGTSGAILVLTSQTAEASKALGSWAVTAP